MPEAARILLLIDDAGIGGGQQHVFDLATRLDRRRFAPEVACAANGPLVDRLRRAGVPVHAVALDNRPSPADLLACTRLLRRVAPEILHTHGGTAGAVGRAAGALARVPVRVHTHHGIHYLRAAPARRAIFRAVDRALLRWTDHTICVAASDLELGVRAGVVDRAAASVIENGIDVTAFAAAREARDVQPAPALVGTVGRLHPQKGQRDLVAAMPEVVRRHPDARLVIVGDGELRATLAAQARGLGLESRVELAGERADVPALLAEMAVFVLPSLWEGLPLALLEAMAAGVPCVATAVDGVNAVLEDRVDGLLVPPARPAGLAAAIAELLSDRDLAAALARRARAKVVARFDVAAMVRRTEAVYAALLEGRPSP